MTQKGFSGGSVIKNLPALQEPQETWVQSLDREDSPGEGNDNPLQYSGLENPMDREAWWTTAQGVTRSQTRLKQQSMHASLAQNRNESFLKKSSLISVT